MCSIYLKSRIHLCVLWGLFFQLLSKAPWSQFQFATTASLRWAIGNLISEVSPVWEGSGQSWTNWQREALLRTFVENISNWRIFSGHFIFHISFWTLTVALCGNIWKYAGRAGFECLRKTTQCRWWCAVWFVSWDCNEIGDLMNLPKGVWGGTIWLGTQQWNDCLNTPFISCVVFPPVTLKFPCSCFDSKTKKINKNHEAKIFISFTKLENSDMVCHSNVYIFYLFIMWILQLGP